MSKAHASRRPHKALKPSPKTEVLQASMQLSQQCKVEEAPVS
jgi:hypothetical protein